MTLLAPALADVVAAAVVTPPGAGPLPFRSAFLTSVGHFGGGGAVCLTTASGIAPGFLAAAVAFAGLPGTGGTLSLRFFSSAVWISASSFSGLSPKSQMLYGPCMLLAL